jgi:hypothetical protein
MTAAEYEALADTARERTKKKIEAAKQTFGLGSYKEYDIDLTTATIKFSDERGTERVRSDIQAAGTWSWSPTTWLWSWDNESIPDNAKARLTRVREFGEEHELVHFMGSFDPCPEHEAWTITAVATDLLDAECIYRAPGKSTNLFLLLFNIKKVG